jgi:hypothetical protein
MSVRRGIRTLVTTGIAAEEREALAREDESREVIPTECRPLPERRLRSFCFVQERLDGPIRRA